MNRRPLRLVHLAGGSGPNANNGVGRAVYHLATAQRALGHDVTIVSERAEYIDGRPRIEPSALLAARTRLARRARHAAPTLMREILDDRPDLIHLHSIHVLENVSISRYLRSAKVPYCVTVHGGLSHVAQRSGRIKKAALWYWGEGDYLDGAQFIHALTTDEAKDIAAYGVKAPTVVAPNGIDAAGLPRPKNPTALLQRAPQLAGHRVFMFMGRVAPIQKGLDLLLDAFAHANLANARLVILGPDFRDSRTTLQSQVARLGLGSRVLFLDGESAEGCADLVAGADVFVHTSRWEGMSLAVLEAAVWEKPCLLTSVADPNGALAQAGAAVIVDGTSESIAAGLQKMAALDHEALLDMGRRARCTATTQFTWNGAATTLIDAYGRDRGLDR